MNRIFKIVFLLLLTTTASSYAQKNTPLYSLCGKTGNCSMTWDEFMSCSKQLTPIDKKIQVSSFILTIYKAEKKDTIQIEYPSKGNMFSKQALESIEKLHKDKKMGNKVLIEAVQVVESGKDARKVPGMTISLN